jgi:hypothetical protein
VTQCMPPPATAIALTRKIGNLDSTLTPNHRRIVWEPVRCRGSAQTFSSGDTPEPNWMEVSRVRPERKKFGFD